MAIEVEGDVARGNLNDDLRPFLRKFWHGKLRHLLRMRMLVRICVNQRHILVRARSILRESIKLLNLF